MYFCWDDVYMLTLINSCIYKQMIFKILDVDAYSKGATKKSAGALAIGCIDYFSHYLLMDQFPNIGCTVLIPRAIAEAMKPAAKECFCTWCFH